jgi:inositol-phosphate phosphatase/L-galactose 1-phosphate phosphatase
MAAGSVILEEAGGVVLDPAGGPFNLMARRVLGANGHLGPKVAAILAPCALGPSEPPTIIPTR